MLSSKDMLICFIVFSTFAFSLSEVSESASIETSQEKGNCSCGGFSSPTPEADSEPLLSQAPGLVVACNETGESTCKNLCLALATATKAKGPEILCTRLVSTNELKLSAFYKICDTSWEYAGMTAEEPLCCEETKPVICPTTESVTSNVTHTVSNI